MSELTNWAWPCRCFRSLVLAGALVIFAGAVRADGDVSGSSRPSEALASNTAAESALNEQWLPAPRANDVKTAGALVDRIDDVNLANADNRTALMVAAKKGRVEIVRRLIARGADVNAINHNGGTALMFGAISGDTDLAKLLLSNGAFVDARGSNGWGAVMVAAAKGHSELVSLLLEHDADPNLTDVYGWTPLIRAAYENRTGVVAALAGSKKLTIDHRDDQGATALHHAAGFGHVEIVSLLLAHGTEPCALDHKNEQPKDRASENDHAEIVGLLEAKGC